jgi:hypothetical protein
LISRTLALRKSHPALFAEGYTNRWGCGHARKSPLRIRAPPWQRGVVVAVPRLVAALDRSPAGATPSSGFRPHPRSAGETF